MPCDLHAILMGQTALQHLIARHADADQKLVAHGLAACFQNLETEAHAIGK